MNFSRPTHPIRRSFLSILLGVVFVVAFYFLWIQPQGEVQHTAANRTTRNIGLFHAWQRHDRWFMEPVATPDQQIGLPTFSIGRGMRLTLALTFTLLVAECALYHIAIEPKKWRKRHASSSTESQADDCLE